MPRVIGIDPGTVSIDLCGLADGEVFLDRSVPTAQAMADPAGFIAMLTAAGPLDLIVGPSGYGLPLTHASAVTEEALRLAFLAAPGETGGIGGLHTLARALVDAGLPVIFTPGVIHLATVPAYRKVNRVDMGTADKVCAAALAIHEQSARRKCEPAEVAFVMLELGGAFTAALAVDGGRIVDGAGGTAGALGLRAPGALDGEVAFLAGEFSKSMLFHGGAATILGNENVSPEQFAEPRTTRAQLAWEAYLESATKCVAAMLTNVPRPREIVLSGRLARVEAIGRELMRRLTPLEAVTRLHGLAHKSKEGAQGAALIADGLAGGRHKILTDTMRLQDARGTALDHLYVIGAHAARRHIGLPSP